MSSVAGHQDPAPCPADSLPPSRLAPSSPPPRRSPGLGEPCSDFCADGLACNYDVSPAVCAAWPVGGEPCVVGGCAANFICDYATPLCVDEPALLCGL